MSINPYESPRFPAVQRLPVNEGRATALRSVRIALLILLVPAVYNFICFNFQLPTPFVYRAINTIGLLLIVIAVWFFGLAVLEFACRGIHSIAARNATLEDWKATLYVILGRTPWFAIPGAALWAIWVLAFYQLDVAFYDVSLPVGIAAHVLGACLYVPLIYRWYRLERTAAPQPRR